MSTELLPCPFCGSPASLDASGDHSTAWGVHCTNEDCAIDPSAWEPDGKDTTIAAWNRRASDSDAAGGKGVPEIRKVAKRNLRSLIENDSADKALMLSCLEELS